MFSSRAQFVNGSSKLKAASYVPLGLLVGLALACIAFLYARDDHFEHSRGRFDAEVVTLIGAVRQSLTTADVLMKAGAGMIAAHPDSTPADWRLLVSAGDLKRQFSGFQGIGYLKVLGANSPIAAGATTATDDGRRSELMLMEPHQRWGAEQLGAVDGPRRQAMARARQANATTRSGKLLLRDGHGTEHIGFIMYLPVLSRETMLGETVRPVDGPDGYVVMPVAMPALFTGLVHNRYQDVSKDLRIEVFDGRSTQEADRLFDSAVEEGYVPPEKPWLNKEFVIDRFGREWTYRVSSLPAYDAMQRSFVPLLTLVAGLASALMLFGLLFLLDHRTRTAVEAVRDSAVLRVELLHRVRNTLAVVQSIANRSLSNSHSVTEGRDRLADQLSALARAQSLITENAWRGASIHEIVQSELASVAEDVTLTGPKIVVSPQVAQTLALTMHALAVGAMHRQVRSLAVSWSLREMPEPVVELSWRETSAEPSAGLANLSEISGHGLVMTEAPKVDDQTARFSFTLPIA